VLLPTVLDFLQKFLGTTSLTTNQWLVCIAAAIDLLLVDEVIKFFLRRRRPHAPEPAAKPVAGQMAA
jgi:Ca2+-transporting ATPase